MKRISRLIAALMVITLLTASCACAETFYSKQVAYCDQYVSLRTAPRSSADVICRVGVGKVVMAAPYNSEFSYCCYNGRYGYIKTDYLSSYIHTYSEGIFGIYGCDSYVTMREMPDTGSPARCTIPLGATLDAIYYNDYSDGPYMDGAFAYVSYHGLSGFVLWKYIRCVRGQ